MSKLITYGVIILLLLVGGYVALVKLKLLPNIFESKPVVIAETAVLVKEVKTIAELFSACQYDELTIDSVYYSQTTLGKIASFTDKYLTLVTPIISHTTDDKDKKLVYVVKGRVYAGFDLGMISDSSFRINGDTLQIKLDQPKIMDVVVNPSDFTTFIEEGSWSFEEAKAVKLKAVEKFKQRALEKGILETTRKNGIKSLESFYKSLGFKSVVVELAG